MAFGVIATAIGCDVAKGIKLKDAADYAVKRGLLERSYPAYKSFRGLMHSGLMPAAIIDDKSSYNDFSSYFFMLLRPDGESSDADERTDETFRNDTLLIWLNGGPGVSFIRHMRIWVLFLRRVSLTFQLKVFKYDWAHGREWASYNSNFWSRSSFSRPGTSRKKQIRMD